MSVRVGFVGAGKMASALARGFVEGRAVGAASNILASCPPQDKHLLEDFDRSEIQSMRVASFGIQYSSR